MRARPESSMTDEELRKHTAELVNKSLDEVTIKQIKGIKYLCVTRNENQTQPDIHLLFWSFCNIDVDATLIRENEVVTPYFKIPVEGDKGARILIHLLTTEKMLKITRDNYIIYHPKLQTLLSQSLPGQFEMTKHGAKVFLTKEQAAERFKTIFSGSVAKNIHFEQDHFILPYFTYESLPAQELTMAIAELLLTPNAQNRSPHSPRLFCVVVAKPDDEERPSNESGIHSNNM